MKIKQFITTIIIVFVGALTANADDPAPAQPQAIPHRKIVDHSKDNVDNSKETPPMAKKHIDVVVTATPPPAAQPHAASTICECEHNWVSEAYSYDWGNRHQLKGIPDEVWKAQGYRKADTGDLALQTATYRDYISEGIARDVKPSEHEFFWVDGDNKPCYRYACGNPVDFMIADKPPVAKVKKEIQTVVREKVEVCVHEDCRKKFADPEHRVLLGIEWDEFDQKNQFVRKIKFYPFPQEREQFYADHPEKAGHSRTVRNTRPSSYGARSSGQVNPLGQVLGLVSEVRNMRHGGFRQGPPPPHIVWEQTPSGPRQVLVP